MNLVLEIPVKPFSVNAMYGQKKFKTSKAREWSYQVFHVLNKSENIKAMRDFKNSFDSEKHCIHAKLTFLFPEDVLLLKKGTGISGRAFDVSNMEKCIIDLIFDKQYYDKEPPYGCENLDLDDKYITQMHSRKRVHSGGDYSMVVELELKSLQEEFNF